MNGGLPDAAGESADFFGSKRFSDCAPPQIPIN
jgi:hypothetical protein